MARGHGKHSSGIILGSLLFKQRSSSQWSSRRHPYIPEKNMESLPLPRNVTIFKYTSTPPLPPKKRRGTPIMKVWKMTFHVHLLKKNDFQVSWCYPPGTNVCHLWKRKFIDSKVFWEGMSWFKSVCILELSYRIQFLVLIVLSKTRSPDNLLFAKKKYHPCSLWNQHVCNLQKKTGRRCIHIFWTQKWRFGRWFSFSTRWFFGSMSNFGGVISYSVITMITYPNIADWYI